MKTGTPSVTTSLGAEGMSETNLWGGKIAGNPEEFANAAVELYSNRPKWEKAQKTGFEILEKKYSKMHFSRVFKERIESVLHKLQEHREANFTGAMLQHHQLASTKFMSKYIEMKNQLEKLTSKK